MQRYGIARYDDGDLPQYHVVRRIGEVCVPVCAGSEKDPVWVVELNGVEGAVTCRECTKLVSSLEIPFGIRFVNILREVTVPRG